MSYKDKDRQREFSRKWAATRRLAYFEGRSCVQCGSTDRLELDHIDRLTKVSHSIWSWSETKRNIELLKCQVLCYVCHKQKSIKETQNVLRKMGPPGTSWCGYCNQFKPEAEFYKRRSRWNGLTEKCRNCEKTYKKLRRIINSKSI